MTDQTQLNLPEEAKLKYYKIKSSTVEEMKDLLGSIKGTKEQDMYSRIRELEDELKHLRNTKKYGLVWDAEKEPEQVVLDCQKKLPILQEIKDRKIISDDSGDSNLLIEGDNYHSLQVLSYTHKEAIDVIYIDPPYNTGNKDFIYNDKIVDSEDIYRHSKWLSFMEKRLRLAFDLLKEEGVIFISIDDNEQSQLKLLCDEIFGEENFVAILPRLVKKGGKSTDSIAKNNDYVITYFKSNKSNLIAQEHNDEGFKYKDQFFETRGLYKLNQTLDYDSIQYSASLDYIIDYEGQQIIPGGVSKIEMNNRIVKNPARDFCWRWSKKMFDFGYKNGFIVVKNYKNKPPRIYTKTYLNATIGKNSGEYFVEHKERRKPISSIELINNIYSNDSAKKELKEIFGEVKFDYPKPVFLLKTLYKISTRKDSLILDFMAGSGTTGHAVLDLNKEDGGNRKFILCTNNENNICEEVTYERVKRVSQGYTNPKGQDIEGLGANLRYYKTAFVEVDSLKEITDEKKLEITYNAGELLAIKEGIYNEVFKTNYGQVFENSDDIVAIYFKESTRELMSMAEELEKIQKEKGGKVIWYIYGNPFQTDSFSMIENLILKDIPDPILKVYREINKV